ncbi:putative bifunctional diguanylate cyclase/phosphodiesterase [Candidatus Blastococcus massiliensis]|uniref:putative bifunctional diguanylate cyclase/phosphodiesterase n=1 Tax=Candidatus Blastococcus massiliensis TaxID=1470358 RepID=UPI0004B7223C|nr:GGDEF domain-containing phosphodiesterase [Candidatus Blastococcus massiliensis]
MDPRRWWLLAVAVPVAIACAVAAATPALQGLGDLALVVVGLVAAATVWIAGARSDRSAGWRLLAVAPLFPVLGAVLVGVVDPADPLDGVILRWLPTVPGYLLGILGLLCLVDRRRLWTGRRGAVEVALFLTASIVTVRLLVSGSVDEWATLLLAERVVLAAAVVVTSATMAAALVVLGLVEPARRRMAVVLLVGTVLLTAGRGIGTSAILSDAAALTAASRFLVAGGLLLLAVAVFLDPGRTAPAPSGAGFPRSVDIGQLLPMGALLVAVAAAGIVRFTGGHLDMFTWGGLLLAVLLAVVHRWFTACQEHQLSARLRRSEAYFRSLVHSGVDAMIILDGELRVTWASPALDRVLGPAATELLGRHLLDAVHPEDRADLAEALAADARAAVLLGLRLADADGVWRCMEAGISDLRGDADVAGVVLHCRDMTERQARERSLQSVAYIDPKTALPNRAGMLQLLDDRLAAGTDEDRDTLLVVELDGLLAAREHTGRDVVGAVVAEVGRRLRDTVRGEDVVARMGGGAFAVLAAGTGADADRLADRILSVVEQPLVTTAGLVDLSASVGLVDLDHGLDVEDLLVRADLAVRAARTAGTGMAQRYRAELGEAAARRDRLREDLRTARAKGELVLLFQPVFSLTDRRVAGVEAQLRWRHSELGEIPPAEFLPIAEQAGLLGELQRFALDEAALAAAALPESPEPIPMGVDAPAGYVAAGTLVADVEAALRRSGLAPERLVLEIGDATVTSTEDRDALDISTLRLMGVRVALAGFGGDSSMLTHLTRLPIDVVKLDRTFVSRIDRDARMRALCESLVGIGRALRIAVVAEGVETSAQLAALSGFGCDLAQGFLLARPMPFEQLMAALQDGAGALRPGMAGVR